MAAITGTGRLRRIKNLERFYCKNFYYISSFQIDRLPCALNGFTGKHDANVVLIETPSQGKAKSQYPITVLKSCVLDAYLSRTSLCEDDILPLYNIFIFFSTLNWVELLPELCCQEPRMWFSYIFISFLMDVLQMVLFHLPDPCVKITLNNDACFSIYLDELC